jgi:PAS domain S-box-containing protein
MGKTLWFQVVGSPITWENKPAMLNMFTDITQQKQTEESLQASEEKYRTLIEYANEAILVSQDGRLKYVNQMTFRLFPGYSEKELINTPVTNFIHPDDYTRLIKDYRKQINNESVLPGNEYRIIMKEGSIKWAEIGTALIDWENGPAILYFITDITERKRAAEALQASEEKYRLIVENSNDIIFTFSATGEFIYVSPSVKITLGYSPADITGKPFSSLVHPEDVQGLQQAIQRNIKDGSQTPGGNEFRLRNASGEWRWHNASGNAVFDATGKFLNFVGISKDITERKQMTTRINELNNILQLVSDINQLIVETDNEADLLQKACRRFVESRQYRLAWIGFKKTGSFDVVPAIWCGQGADYLSLVRITWDDSPLGQGPTGTTIKTGKPSVMRDILNEPKFEPWKAEARKRGFQSSAALPLIIQDKVMGALTVYSTAADAFNENELRLLSELAGDLSLGIEKIRRREEISKTQEALKASEQNFRNSLDNSFLGIRIGDTGEQTLYVNQAFLDIFGYENTKEVSASPPTEHYTPASYADSVLRKEKIARGETIPDIIEVDIIRKDGDIRHLQIYRKEIFWNGKQESQVIYDDITERAQAEEALRDSEQKLREAQEIAHLGFWQWDMKTGNVKWSDEVFKIFRLDPKGFTPQIDSILALSPWPEDHRRDQELIKRATESHVPGSYEQKFLRPDKSIGYYYSNFQGEYDDSGNLISIIGTVLDITQRKIAEEALKASEQNFRNSLDNSFMGTYIVDVDRHILYVNQAFLDIFGYKNIEEASASPPHEHYTPQEYANFLLRREKELHGEPITGEGEADIIRTDGSIRHLQVFRREILWDGKPQLQIIYHDITERKQAEEALKASEENFRNSISKSPLGIRVRDKDGRILFSNQAFLDMFGYKNIEEVKIHPPPEYYTPESYADYLVRKNKRQHGESLPDAMEIDIKRNDGTMRHLQVLRREVLWDGKQEYQILYNDITERKRAEEALKVSEQNFRNSLDNSFIGTYIVDTDETIPYANQAFLDMFGYENIEEVKASPPAKHYAPESYADFLLRMEKELQGETIPTQVEVDVIRKDGTSRHLQVFRREVIWDGKQQHQVLFFDITERKRIEDELKASEQNFRNTLDVSSMGIRIVDADFHILYANQAFLKVFGYKNIEEAKVSPPREHYTPESYAEYLTRHASLLHGEPTPEKLEIDIVRPDGATRHVQAFYKEVFWDGKIQYQTLYNDITERKQIEDALRASEQNFRNSLDAFLIGIRITTVDSYTLYANQTFLDMFGYENIEEAQNSPPQEHYTPESYTDYLQRKEQFAGGESIPDAVDIDVIRKDGSIRHLHVFNNKVRWNGKEEFQGLYQDITELKQAEEEKRRLEEKAEIASRLAAVGGMAAGIAHEINNPLTGVLGFSQMLLERENVPEDIRENLTLIADGSQRVADIVKRLLTFARQAKPVKAMANLNELISNTLKLREYVMKTSNIEVITKFDQELPLSLVDPGQLQQVFLNLIVNAEQAIKGGSGRGTLTITTEKKENNIRMSFQDDGPGISKENMKRLFDPFFTTKAPGEGTGLGLSLSRSIILEHNGSMSVESEPGHGATFIIELPVITSFLSETEALSPVAKEMPAATKKGRILAVDDEAGVRTLLEKVLTQNGHTVDTIGDASQALDKLEAGAVYDVILTDVRMPGMSGIELYSRILEKMPALKDRIIFVTGDVMGADIKEFLAQNNLPYLAKPFNIKLLKETIENTLMTSHRGNDKPDGVTNENT